MMIDCFLCGVPFRYGPERYAGRHIRAWNVDICEGCLSSNHDGLNPHHEAKLLRQLAEVGAPTPQRNGNGWFPIPPTGQ